MAKYDRRPGNRDKLRPVTPPDTIRDRTSLEFSLESRNIPFLYIYTLSPPLWREAGLRPQGICDCVRRNPYFGGRKVFSLSLSVSLAMRNYSGTGEEIGEMPQQGCALSRSFFARKYRRERGRDLVVELIWFVLMSPGDLSPLFRITFAWILLG